jgi:hypothetical protein
MGQVILRLKRDKTKKYQLCITLQKSVSGQP